MTLRLISPIIEKTEQKKTVEEKPATNPRPRPLPAAAYSYTAPPVSAVEDTSLIPSSDTVL